MIFYFFDILVFVHKVLNAEETESI